MSRSNYASGFAEDLSDSKDPKLGDAFDGVRTSFDQPPVRRSTDRPPTGDFRAPSIGATIPEHQPKVDSNDGYKQTEYFAAHQRRSMDLNKPRRSLSNGELEMLDKPKYPEATVIDRPEAGIKPFRTD